MRDDTLSGCAPEFALWSFPDLGYLSYYVGYGLATGQIEAEAGQQFEAGRLGEYTIEEMILVAMPAFALIGADQEVQRRQHR